MLARMDEETDLRRKSFDLAAERYDASRPKYPEWLIKDLVAKTGLDENSRILEVGPGTGQLTLQLAKLGFSLVGVELGGNLARIAQSNLKGHEKVEIVTSDFDEYPLPEGYYDLIIAATSFHWLNPATRFQRTGSAIKDQGFLAIISTHHINGGTSDFFRDSQKCYSRWDPGTTEEYHLPEESEVELRKWEDDLSSCFGTWYSETYRWRETYTSIDYVSLLMTYSDIITMNRRNRDGLLECIARTIDSEYGGSITKQYLSELFIARKN